MAWLGHVSGDETAKRQPSVAVYATATFTATFAVIDQGQNLAGKFFQGSLPPYVAFLYFLSYEKNQVRALVLPSTSCLWTS